MIDLLLRYRVATVAAALTAIVLSAFGAKSLSIDPNNRVFFGEGHQHFRQLINLEATFGSSTSLVFVISSSSSLFESPELESAIRWLAQEAWRIDGVVSVDSVASYPHVEDLDEELIVGSVLDFVCHAERCARDRATALRKPHLIGRYLDEGLRAFAVVAKVDLSDADSDRVIAVANAAEALTVDFNARFVGLEVHLTGGVPMMNAFFVAAQNDSASLILVVVIVLSMALYLFLGGLAPMILMVFLGISAVAVTMGVAGWAGLVINTATATVPLIVFTLVVASAMHLFLHIVREEKLDSSEAVEKAVRASLGSNWKPVALTASTTAVGLLSMLFVSAPPLKQLGVLSAFGVMVGATLTLTLIPCVFSFLPRLRASNYLMRTQRVLNKYARWFEERRPSMVVVFVAFLLALSGLALIKIDEDFVRYFSSETKFRVDTEEITRLLSGPYHIDIVYDSGETAGVYDPVSISQLSALVKFLREEPGVVNVASLIDVLGEVSRSMAGESDISRRSADELAQYFLSYELSLAIGQSTTDFLDTDHRFARVSVLLNDVSMADVRGIDSDIREWARVNGFGEKVVVTGEGIPTAFLSSESIREMGIGILLSILFSAFVVGAYFGSLRACFSIFAATGVPILAGFGVWGWIESDIGMAATLVVATTIGVVIDDTIHLTYRYVDGLRNLDLTRWGATAYSIYKTGTAILVTSVVLVAGLLVLIVSEFRMNSTFGACSSLIIALALLYNLTVAPRLLSEVR